MLVMPVMAATETVTITHFRPMAENAFATGAALFKVPKGTMYIGLADAAGATTLHRQFLGDRQRVRTFAAQLALDLLRRRITGRP